MVESTIEFKITFDTSTTSYYNMLDRMVKVLKDELRKAYYDNNSEPSNSESDSDSDAEESIFKPANVKRVRTKVKQFQPGLTDKEIRKANQSDNLKQGNTKDPPDTEN